MPCGSRFGITLVYRSPGPAVMMSAAWMAAMACGFAGMGLWSLTHLICESGFVRLFILVSDSIQESSASCARRCPGCVATGMTLP